MRPNPVAAAILATTISAPQLALAGGVQMTAATFLATYCNRTIPEGLAVSIRESTSGSYRGNCVIRLLGGFEPGEGVTLNVTGRFAINGQDADTQIQTGERNTITAGTIEWVVTGNIQVKNDTKLTAQNSVRLLTDASIQLEENFWVHGKKGDVEFSAGAAHREFTDPEAPAEYDGDIQIKKVEDARLPVPNVKAGRDLIVKSRGDIQIGDGNRLRAAGHVSLLGLGDFSDIQVGKAETFGASVPGRIAFPTIQAGKNLTVVSTIDGDVQIQDDNVLHAGETLTLIANGEGDLQLHAADPDLPYSRLVAKTIEMGAGGDINIQNDRPRETTAPSKGALRRCNTPYPDIRATQTLRMVGDGEVEVEPGNWLCAGDIWLETKGVEVQVQPRSYVTLEAMKNITLQGLQENAGITVGEYAALRAGEHIHLRSGDERAQLGEEGPGQGEGDTRVKENSVLRAGNSITIESFLSGSTEIKEQVVLDAVKNVTVRSGLSGQTVVKEANLVTARTGSIMIESGESGETYVKEDGTTLDARAGDVTVQAGPGGQCVVEGGVKVTAKNPPKLCP